MAIIEEANFSYFESWLLDVCALTPERLTALVANAKKHACAPIPNQVVDGIVLLGNEAAAQRFRVAASRVLATGPRALSEEERLELRWALSTSLVDLQHAGGVEVPALAAVRTPTSKIP